MAKISEHNSYNIDDLVTVWKSGWQHLEKFADLQSPQKLESSGDKSKSPLQRIHLVVKDILCPYLGIGKYLNMPKTLPDYTVILNLAASSSRTVYKPVKHTGILGGYPLDSWAKDKAKLHRSLQKVTNAFAISDDYEQAFSKIATKKNLEIFKEHWSQQNCSWTNGEYLSVKIEPLLKKMMKWLGYGLKNKNRCEEAWWNCLWLIVEPIVETMLEIKKRISADIPVDEEHIRTLNYYISHGYPDIDFLWQNDGKHQLQIILRPHTPKMIINSPFEVMTVILLVQPAFVLAQALQENSKLQFVRECRAPSCGKRFYTGWKDATNCPGSQGGKKNKCSLEWNRYKRYLKKIGNEPETDWHKQQLNKDFLAYDKD